MIRAAIYARRSTDEHQAASLEVQLGEARSYCTSKGWTVDEQHVFIEDAVSRAEFVKRPALIRMLNGAKDGEFEVVVVRDETRLGGDITRTGLLIQDLLETGRDLYYYFTDERVTLDGAVDKFMVAARNFAAELEREKISQRTREHLMVKARKGLNAGGRCYGYDNVRVGAQVEYRINEAQAAIVRDLFRWFASGDGYTAIARRLNDAGVASPTSGRRGTGSWSRSQIRCMLLNQRYRGIIAWGRSHKTYKGGTKVRIKKPACEVLQIEVPALRLIDDDLWVAVTERFRRHREMYGAAAPKRGEPKHLLTGLARCAECGGPIRADSAKWGSRTIKLYACKYNRSRGSSVCSNGLRRPVEELDACIVEYLKRNILSEEVVIEVVRELRRRLEERAQSLGPDLEKLETQARKLKMEISNLGDAIATMGGSSALTEKLAEREIRLKRIEAEIQASKAAPRALATETHRLEREAHERAAELRGLLERKPDGMRKALAALLDGPLLLRPESDGKKRRYWIEGKIAAEEVLCSTGNVPNGMTAPPLLRIASPIARLSDASWLFERRRSPA